MEVVVSSEQIRRIGQKILERIYGDLKKFRGVNYTSIFVDGDGKPRIAVNYTIFETPTVLILKEDFDTFQNVIPIKENEFGEIFKEWFQNKYFAENFNKLSTTSQHKMEFINPIYRSPYGEN